MCVNGDGLVTGEGTVSGRVQRVAAGLAGRGLPVGRRGLAEGQVCMNGDGTGVGVYDVTYEWRDRGCVRGECVDGGAVRTADGTRSCRWRAVR